MLSSPRRQRSQINAWPGYVDALSALLMLVIFMLMIYMVSQLFLSQTLSDRESELSSLNQRLNEITRLLLLEELRAEELTLEITNLRTAYEDSLSREDVLQTTLNSLLEELTESEDTTTQLTARANELQNQLELERTAFAQLQNLADTQQGELEQLQTQQRGQQAALEGEVALSRSQQNQINQLTRRIESLQRQLQEISAALRLQEALVEEKDLEISGLGERLNRLLAERVNELERYQSEFFSRLRDILEANENIQIVGDRFLLPAELFFASGSAEIGTAGQLELNKLANVLLDITEQIPNDVDWILRIDGHTDRIPMRSGAFPSNWELSTARAVSVVRYLANQGVPEQHMAATGFGEFYPIDTGNSAEALQRNRRIEIKLTSR